MIAYKLFKIKQDKLYPLYILTDKEVPMNVWLEAENGELLDSGKVKSKLGQLCYRPGWHLADIPYAAHIGQKDKDGNFPAGTVNHLVYEKLKKYAKISARD